MVGVNEPIGDSRKNHLYKRRDFRKLEDAKLQGKYRNQLCFRCDEKFGPGNAGENEQLRVILMDKG